MNISIGGVVGFLQDNDRLIKQLMETGESATQEIRDCPSTWIMLVKKPRR